MRGITRNGRTYTLTEITAASDSFPLRWQDAAGDFVQSTRMNGEFWDATPNEDDITQWEVRQPAPVQFTTAQPEHLTVGMLGLTREGRQVKLVGVDNNPALNYPLTWERSDNNNACFTTTRNGAYYREGLGRTTPEDIIHWQVL